MDKFEILFGIKASEVKENCILLPLASKYILQCFGSINLNRGKIYSSANTNDFTIIQTGIGHTFTGDAVLYLKDTVSKNIILFGSCGLTSGNKGLSIGSLACPSECYSYESFSDMLYNKEGKVFYPDKTLLENFLSQNTEIKSVTCATVSSLKLEEERLDIFKKKNIDVLDMECSAFFSAGQYTGIKTLALFYVSDIINSKPFYMNLDTDSKFKISGSIKNAITVLMNFSFISNRL